MANSLYTKATLSGYNSGAPSDDGSALASNEVTWAKHKTKLGDPLKTYIDAVNNNTESAFDVTVGKAADYTALRDIGTSGLTADEIRYVRYRSSAGDGGGGTFYWSSSDHSATGDSAVPNDEVNAGEGDGGIVVAPASDKTGASGAWFRQWSGYKYPEWWGAVGSAGTDDYSAFNAMHSSLSNGDAVWLSTYYELQTTLAWTKSISIRGPGPQFAGFLANVGSTNNCVEIGNTSNDADYLKTVPMDGWGVAGATNSCKNGLFVMRGNLDWRNVISYCGAAEYATRLEGIIGSTFTHFGCDQLSDAPVTADKPANGVYIDTRSSTYNPNANLYSHLLGRVTLGVGVTIKSSISKSAGCICNGIYVEGNDGRGLFADTVRGAKFLGIWEEANGTKSQFKDCENITVHSESVTGHFDFVNTRATLEGGFEEITADADTVLDYGPICYKDNSLVDVSERSSQHAFINLRNRDDLNSSDCKTAVGSSEGLLVNGDLRRWNTNTQPHGWDLAGGGPNSFTQVTGTRKDTSKPYSVQVQIANGNILQIEPESALGSMGERVLGMVAWTYGAAGEGDYELTIDTVGGSKVVVREGEWTATVAQIDGESSLTTTNFLRLRNQTGVEKNPYIDRIELFDGLPDTLFPRTKENVGEYYTHDGLWRGTGTAAPTSGNWKRGDIVWNETPSASGTVGWVCVSGGSPGTWKTFGSIAS